MDHPFVVGGKYRNRESAYEVLRFEGDKMVVRLEDGSQKTWGITMQARIWENIQADEAPPPVWLHRGDEYDGLDTQPIAEFVQVVLAHFSAPYPTDITDQVCLAIEKNPDWLERYNHLIEHFSSQGKDGKSTVNTSIGQFTKQMTGMITLKEGVKSKSTLMKSYSKLGYKGKP